MAGEDEADRGMLVDGSGVLVRRVAGCGFLGCVEERI